jgi:hypothetical protein
MNLSTGLSTKPVRLAPDGAGIKNRWSANQAQYVPLSVFFMGIPEDEADPDALFGLRMPSREKTAPPKEKKASGGDTKGKDKGKGDEDEANSKEGGKDKGKGGKAAAASPAGPKGPEPEPQPAAQSKGPESGVSAKQEGYTHLFGLIRDGYSIAHYSLDEERAERCGAVAASMGRTGMEGKRKLKGKPEERPAPWDKPHKCKYCDAPATRDLIWADGRAYIPVCDKCRKRGEHRILVKNHDSIAAAKPVAQEGMTTTANVPTLPVPIGAGDGRKFLDRPDDPKRKKKKRRSLARGLYLLLRQQPA